MNNETKTFSIGEAISFGWKKVTDNPGFFLISTALIFFLPVLPYIFVILSSLVAAATQTAILPEFSGLVFAIIPIYLAIVILLVPIWVLRIGIDAVRDNKLTYKSILPSWQVFWKYLLSVFLLAILVYTPLIPLFIFGFAIDGQAEPSVVITILFLLTYILSIGFLTYISLRLFFAPFFVIDKKLGPINSIKASWRITYGNFWKILLFNIVIQIIAYIGVVAFLVGVLIAVPVSLVATAYVYKKLSEDNPAISEFLKLNPERASENI